MPPNVDEVTPSPARESRRSQAAPAHDGGDLESSAAGRQSAERQDQLIERVGDALRANLARGFLEGEARIRQIAEALNAVILLSDRTGGQVLFANAAYEEVWGRSRAELYANPLALLEGVHEDDRDAVRDALATQLGPGYEIEFRVVRPSGEERWVRGRGFPVRGADGEVDRIASIIEDVTDRKHVKESHARLIRGFTHDVKNPLGAADGYLSLLEEGVFGDMPKAQREAVAHARRSIGVALKLVSGLLDIERAEAGQLDIRRASMAVGAAVVEIVAEFHAAAAAKGIDLSWSPSDDDPLIVRSDAERVRQILANLVSNAVKYTQPNGRVEVRVGVAARDASPAPGRWVSIAVTDNGPGIPAEHQQLVFREFTRVDPNAAAGSGIGLAISHRLAHALGGEITLASTPGVGSTFTLWLPLDR